MKVLLTTAGILLMTANSLGIDLPPKAESKSLSVCAELVPELKLTGTEKKKDVLNALFTDELSDCLRFENYAALDAGVANGTLVGIPNEDPVGFRLRLSGKFPIAQLETNLELKTKLFRLRPAAAGLLYLVSAEFKSAVQKKYGKKWEQVYRPLEPTSLGRTWEYQCLLMGINPNADVFAQNVPPTHVFGLAFDIGRVSLSPALDKILLSVLTRLEANGLLIFIREGKAQAAYHVIAAPASWAELEQYYNQTIQDLGN